MEEYRVECPICGTPANSVIEIPDTAVLFNIKGYESQPNLLWTLRQPDPTAEIGADVLLERDLVEVTEVKCDNGHHITTKHCHYGEIDNDETMLYGPSDKPKVSCPQCGYRLGDHAEFIYRIGKEDDMQFVLRNVTTTSDPAYHYVDAITRSGVEDYNQISTVDECPGCGLNIHFNYSSKVYRSNEKYEGYKPQM
jgi:hypothetical protein